MAVLKALWAILVGTFMAAVLGGIYDYLRPAFIPDPAQYKFVYPWMTGLSGFLAALIAVCIAGVRTAGMAKAAGTAAQPARGAAKGRQEARKPVAGAADMPTFDIDKALKEIKSPSTPAPATSRPSQDATLATPAGAAPSPAAQPAPPKPETGEVQK